MRSTSGALRARQFSFVSPVRRRASSSACSYNVKPVTNVEGRRRARRVSDLKPGAGQSGERELKWSQEARQHRRPAAHEQRGPRVGTHHAPLGVRQQGEVVTPRAAGPRGQPDPGVRRVDHQIQQLLAAGDVPVQRHRPGAENGGDAAHADRAEEDHQLAKQSTGLDAGQVIRWKSWHRWTAICLLASIYLAVAVALQRQQEAGADLDAGLIPITVPELLRLLRDIVIPPPRRDRAHRLHWSTWRRHHQHRARQAHQHWNTYAETTP